MSALPAWLFFALGSALFAALTTIFGKLGVSEINSNLATLIRIAVVLIVIAGIVTYRDEWQPLNSMSQAGVLFLILSALATGFSWLFYYRALQLAPASKVAPIDKLSVVLVIVFSAMFLHETLTWKIIVGAVLIATGVILVAL